MFFKRQVLSGSDIGRCETWNVSDVSGVRGGMFENQVLLWNECQVLREGAGAYQSDV